MSTPKKIRVKAGKPAEQPQLALTEAGPAVVMPAAGSTDTVTVEAQHVRAGGTLHPDSLGRRFETRSDCPLHGVPAGAVVAQGTLVPVRRPRRVRPSIATVAEKCARAPWLAASNHETWSYTRKGSDVDGEISKAIDNMDPAGITMPAARHCWNWFVANFPAATLCKVQVPITLMDPETGEVLAGGTDEQGRPVGTPDLVALGDDGILGNDAEIEDTLCCVVVDWKKREQVLCGLCPPPDDNLQALIYLVASMLEHGAKFGRIILAAWDDDGVWPEYSRVYNEADLWPIIDRIRAIPLVDVDGPMPSASKDPDTCAICYSRHHCPAYFMPAADGMPVALEPITLPGQLTADQALEAARWLKAAKAALKAGGEMADVVQGALEHYVNNEGPIPDPETGKEWRGNPQAGRRRGPTVEECEQMGQPELIKTGAPSVRFGWYKPRKEK